MEWVRTWGVSICCAAVGCAVLQLLAPRGGLGKVLELIGALAFLGCALSPLARLPSLDWQNVPSIPLSESAKSELLQEQLWRQMQTPVQQAVQQEGTAALAAYGLSAEKIEAVTDTDEDGSIYISKIAVTLTKSQAVRRTAVIQLLRERFQLEVEVTVET